MHYLYSEIEAESKGFIKKHSKKIHVGDIIKIFKDEEVPVDVCLLKSSKRNGVCFVDTVNLDGESNLKIKKSQYKTQSLVDILVCTINGILQCDTPNDLLDSWEGFLTITIDFDEETIINLE